MLSKGTWIGIVVVVLIALGVPIAIFCLHPAIASEDPGKVRELGNLGDLFGIAAAVFSAPALVLLLITLHDLRNKSTDQQNQLEALGRITQAINDPVIVLREDIIDTGTYMLIVENIGRSSAYDVRIDVEPKEVVYRFNNQPKDDIHVDDIAFIREPFSSIPPGFRVGTVLANGQVMHEMREREEFYVRDLKFTVTYYTGPTNDHIRRHIKRDYSIHWQNHERTFNLRTHEAHEIYRLRKNLTGTNDAEAPILKQVVANLSAISTQLSTLNEHLASQDDGDQNDL